MINGQALCPACNLKKGSSVTELRRWQADALVDLLRNPSDFLCVATPGAGKTTWALTAARKLIERGEITGIIVVVPTSHLRRQWATAAARMGIQLDHRFTNGNTVVAKDFDGVAVTYQTVAASPLLWRRICTTKPTLVILDEVHHAGDDDHLTWGPALKNAFEEAARRILLSGTPFRSDRKAIPFVRYDEERKAVPSYNYDYGQALMDREVVRPIAFPALTGQVRYREAGATVSLDLADADDERLSKALASALNPTGEWIPSVLRRADEELTRQRSEVPDAGGLVVAADQGKARAYAQILARITGEEPTVAISDDPDASELISRFAKDSTRWIVAVQMVSEGVDIPRLAVGVYASRIRTEMFFRQVVGRFVRMRGTEDETVATLFIPSVQPLYGYAQEIEKTVNIALAEEEERVRQELKEGGVQTSLQVDLVEPLDSSEAVHHATILSGEEFTEAELQRASAAAEQVGLPSSVSPAQVAQLLRMGGAGRVIGTATVQAPHSGSDQGRTLADQKATLRRLINKKVGRLVYATGQQHSHVHATLNRIFGDDAKTATVQTLTGRLDQLDKWLEQA
ncbi:superfamily II DNA or RNA helicase [Actinomadura cellulosilytica]|uniref:Superfamily II DNA or RNA helicase n=1 Tax=Thermomonospora cellulosilytica TaxID=1411118 RepID=A0A7W3RAK5_9ACTN|nr:superfamily II DNA or RNA helicase [Thermomonospora cellulosilytica]